MQQPINALIDNAFSPVNSSLHKAVRGPSSGKVPGVLEASSYLDGVKFASVPRFHPHSLPDYHDSLANGSTYNFASIVGNVAGNIGTGVTEGSDGRHIQGMGSAGNLMEFNGVGKWKFEMDVYMFKKLHV